MSRFDVLRVSLGALAWPFAILAVFCALHDLPSWMGWLAIGVAAVLVLGPFALSVRRSWQETSAFIDGLLEERERL